MFTNEVYQDLTNEVENLVEQTKNKVDSLNKQDNNKPHWYFNDEETFFENDSCDNDTNSNNSTNNATTDNSMPLTAENLEQFNEIQHQKKTGVCYLNKR